MYYYDAWNVLKTLYIKLLPNFRGVLCIMAMQLYLLNKVKNILIINELNVTPINLFFSVLLLFHLENMLKKHINKFHINLFSFGL